MEIFKTIAKKAAVVALGLLLAQGVNLVTNQQVKAVEKENGTCFKSSNICGLNGHNYSNYTYQGG